MGKRKKVRPLDVDDFFTYKLRRSVYDVICDKCGASFKRYASTTVEETNTWMMQHLMLHVALMVFDTKEGK